MANKDGQKISKKSWTPLEDAQLLKLVEELGANGSWTTIASKMGNRSGKQCRERYHNHLKPDICKATWTPEEDALLNASQKSMGNQWAKIARLLPGRSDNSVKNRWHIINRKKNQSAAQSVTANTNTAAAPKMKSGTAATATAKPVIPKLALGLLSSKSPEDSSMYNTSSSQVDISFTTCEDDDEMSTSDLMSCYYSHDSHGHEIVLSDRSNNGNAVSSRADYCCPGSGRREHNITAVSTEENLSSSSFYAGEEMESFFPELDGLNLDAMSFNNTLSSCISELTAHSAAGAADVEDEDTDDDNEWMDELFEHDVFSSNNQNGELDLAVVDRFSEAALTARSDCMMFFELNEGINESSDLLPEDTVENIEEEEVDFALFTDLDKDEVVMKKSTSKSSWFAPSPQLRAALSSFLRTTPRSPLYPSLMKKARVTATPRSPIHPL